MSVRYPRFKAAVCHVSPVFLDSAASASKAVSLIEEAAKAGASLVVFPEGYMPGFPFWVAVRAPIHNHDFFAQLAAQSVRLDGPEITEVRSSARRHGVHVSLGFSEGTDASVGCLWNSNILIGPDGAILNHHRKLVPTFYEKLVWSSGDARGLRTTATDLGRVGMLICGENTNPLARYALMAQGEQVHISTYPPIWPTRTPGSAAAYDLSRAIEIRAGAHAFEAKVFNIVCASVLDEVSKDLVAGGNTGIRDILDKTPVGVSMVLDPTGNHVVGSHSHSGGETIIFADINTEASVEPKQFHDVVGDYNRFDIFELKVNRTAREAAYFEPFAPSSQQPAFTVGDPSLDYAAVDEA